MLTDYSCCCTIVEHNTLFQLSTRTCQINAVWNSQLGRHGDLSGYTARNHGVVSGIKKPKMHHSSRSTSATALMPTQILSLVWSMDHRDLITDHPCFHRYAGAGRCRHLPSS